MQEMTEYQRRIYAEIQAEKKKPSPDKALIKKLARLLTAEDDRTGFLKRQQRARHGSPGSRSPSFGKWSRDDE